MLCSDSDCLWKKRNVNRTAFRNNLAGFLQTPLFHGCSDWLAAVVVGLGFCCRAWLAHATFFNLDEAWHYSVANQDSFLHAYQASLTIWHPPLLVCVLYFWKNLGTSDLILRLPCVIAGTGFCWFYYKWLASILGRTVAWVGLLLVTFLPTMVGMSAELRQYPLMLMFSVLGAYFLERAFAANSAGMMLYSSAWLLLAMLSHYSGFLFAASLGAYAIFRMLTQAVSPRVVAAWVMAQALGLVLAGILYVTQIAKLRALYAGAQPLHRFADWYLPQFYYHPGHDHLALFLFRATFGIFRFLFGWVIVGHLATVLFIAGVVLLLRQRKAPAAAPLPGHLAGILLLLPFVLNWIAVTAGLYPFGRTRHCVFLAIFAVAGVSVALVRIAKQRIVPAAALAIGIIVLCQVFGTQPWHDMLPLAERRHEHMDRALDFIRREVSPADVIYLNKGTEFQLAHYLCDQKPILPDRSVEGFESFRCHDLRVISSFPNDDAVAIDTFPTKWQEMARAYGLLPGSKVWVVEGGWTTKFAETLQARYPQFSGIEAHSFGNYLQIFFLTVGGTMPGKAKVAPLEQTEQ
jgi:hypothetical protein